MVRKGTALVLLWLMTVVVATSQPGLNYCLCQKRLFVGSCECPGPVKHDIRSSEGCEGNCNCSAKKPSHIDSELHLVCRDCVRSLWLKLDDFTGCDSFQTPGHQGVCFQIPSALSDKMDISLPPSFFIDGIRGSPPPPPGLVPSFSRLIRYSVFLV